MTHVNVFFMLLLAAKAAESHLHLQDIEKNLGFGAYGLCQGDCDRDSDCSYGLSCFQRIGTEDVPGCSGDGTAGTDYCYMPLEGTLILSGQNGIPKDAFPLKECEGHCSNDNDCHGELICFQRTGTEGIPGCLGHGESGKNYCAVALPIEMLDSVGSTAAPIDFRNLAHLSLKDVGNNGRPAEVFPLGRCQGDCDNDDECAGSLKCFQRKGFEPVPGCSGDGKFGDDYCFEEIKTLKTVGNNGRPVGVFPLGLCEGDCDNDSECAGPLKCFQRIGLSPVPGCAGEGNDDNDYCYLPYAGYGTVKIVGDNGVPSSAFPLGACEGDCDSDADCEPGLYCYQRNSHHLHIPGCEGTPETDKDYCISIPGLHPRAPTFSPVAPPPTPSGVTYKPGEATVLEKGLLLSTGLTARKIAIKNSKVQFDTGGKSAEPFHSAPDGAAIFVDPNGSGDYVYASNSESSTDGGVGSIRFNAQGQVIGYERLMFEDPQTGLPSKNTTIRNCGVGKTYWGTLLTCEEWNGGQVWEVDPWGDTPGRKTKLGGDGRAYESAAYDNRDPYKPSFYVTTDEKDGPLVKYTPNASVVANAVESGDFSQLLHSNGGLLEYFKITSIITYADGVTNGTYTWTTSQVEGDSSASRFHKNGEGIDIRDGLLYYTTKADKLLFIIDLDNGTFTRSSTASGAFDSQPDQVARVLDFGTGATDGILYFCEDGGDKCGVHGRDALGRYFTILQAASGELSGETTGLAFSPGGMFMYVSFQGPGIIFEIKRTDGFPFYGSTLDIKYHGDGDANNSFRRLFEENAKTCDINSDICSF